MFFATCESMVHTINFVKYMYALIINYTHRNVFVCVCVFGFKIIDIYRLFPS